jgi:transcriptional regulator GlxA family with amidase domain
MKIKKICFTIFGLLLLSIVLLRAYRPLGNLINQPSPWSGNSTVKSKVSEFDSTKKTVFIVADYKLTELFDMLAPFYLFNATEKTNVYIVAKDKTPILIKKDLFVVPQLSFSEVDAMQIRPDVIVIPALSIRDEHQDTSVIAWIKKHFTPGTKLLTICDGASTGAATGLYDGKSITCHASDFDGTKAHFSKPLWVQNVSVAKAGDLYSTAGVSNAVEGSLSVIEELYGRETTQKVITNIHYPFPEIKSTHQSIAMNGMNKFAVAKKILFRRNRDIGVLLENGINEFVMAGIIDTYGRTFPSSFRTYVLNDSIVQTKYGLTLIYSGNNKVERLDELHIAMPEAFSKSDELFFKNIKTIRYDNQEGQYLIDVCLKRIGKQYGQQFENFVRVSLDYN